MKTDTLLLPGAIVVGCGLIGAGLFFGLRASAPPATPAPPQGAAVVAPAQASSAGVVEGPSGPTPSPPAQNPADVAAARQRAVEAVKAAIAKEKKEKYIPLCWEPLTKKEPNPPTSKHFFSLGFDAEGRESVRGLNDIRGESRNDVGMCVSHIPMGIRIPPPGFPVMVDVPVEFP